MRRLRDAAVRVSEAGRCSARGWYPPATAVPAFHRVWTARCIFLGGGGRSLACSSQPRTGAVHAHLRITLHFGRSQAKFNSGCGWPAYYDNLPVGSTGGCGAAACQLAVLKHRA